MIPGEAPPGASEPDATRGGVVREAPRGALRNLPRKFETLEAALLGAGAGGVGQTTLASFF